MPPWGCRAFIRVVPLSASASRQAYVGRMMYTYDGLTMILTEFCARREYIMRPSWVYKSSTGHDRLWFSSQLVTCYSPVDRPNTQTWGCRVPDAARIMHREAVMDLTWAQRLSLSWAQKIKQVLSWRELIMRAFDFLFPFPSCFHHHQRLYVPTLKSEYGFECWRGVKSPFTHSFSKHCWNALLFNKMP